ncbi:MAG: hypothetical protein GOV01_00375 [Candidatus Altiarchaeota archaeon]|nr:hypothetical protein [Candidatus Altiarchaeota archaeon]
MLLGMKFASKDGDMFLNNIAELEKEGVIVNGFEIQAFSEDTPQTILSALDSVKSHGFKFGGLHPPFPAFANDEFVKWSGVAKEAKLNYTVLHAAIPTMGFSKLQLAVREAVNNSKSPTFLENVPIRGQKEGAGSLLDSALLHDKILMDIPHTLYNWEHTRRTNVPPEKQIDMTLDSIKAVHVAENDDGNGGVPVNGGSEQFRSILSRLFTKKDILMIAEPTGGHHNNGKGHKDTCREIWKLWESRK